MTASPAASTPTVASSRPVLLPAESMALTVALAQVRRGDTPDPQVASMCVLALARLMGRYDWTATPDEDTTQEEAHG